MSIAVRRLTEDDIAALRAIRLEALHTHPEAFSADPAAWEAKTPDDWRVLVTKGNWFGAFAGDMLVGICAISAGYSPKVAHTGEFGAVYVRPSFRGKQVGDALIDTVVAFSKDRYEQILLTVNAENASAIVLYERHGFRTIGTVPRALKIDGRYYDELTMIREV